LPEHVHGRAKAHRLLLRRTLLDGWMARPNGAGLEDPRTRAAIAAVIHELAHFYDRTPRGGLSRDPRLLDLAGWQVSPMKLGLRSAHNAFSDRSPDRTTLESPIEVRRSEPRVLPAGPGLRLSPAGPLSLFCRRILAACRQNPIARPTSSICGSAPTSTCHPCYSSIPAGSTRSTTCSPKATTGR
jgi:hypothetical protein